MRFAKQNGHRVRFGLTLIELLAALILAAMMMVALTNVLWMTSRQLQSVRKSPLSTFDLTIGVEMIRADLQAAWGANVSSGRLLPGEGVLVLHGYFGDDGVPKRIAYTIEQIGSDSVLVRTSPAGRKPIFADMGSLEFKAQVRQIPIAKPRSEEPNEPSEDDEDSTSDQAMLLSLFQVDAVDLGGLSEIPSTFSWAIYDSRGQPLMKETISHHGF